MPKRKHHLTKGKVTPKIDPMSDSEIPNTVVVKKGRYKIILAAILALILILILAGLKYFNFINSPFKPNTPQIIRKIDPHALDTCDLTKEGNPLVEDISNQAGVVYGSLKGQIVELDRDEVRQSLVLTLASLDQAQQYRLNIIDNPNLIINAAISKIASSSALKKDQLVRLTFTCNTETNLLEFNKLSILPPPLATKSGQIKK